MLADQPTRAFSIGMAALLDDLGAPARTSGWAGSASDLARAARLRQELALARARAGQLEPACQLADGAVRIYRLLSLHQPARYQPELAVMLTALGLWSVRLGRCQDAASALSDAVGLHRTLLERAGPMRPMRRLRLRAGFAMALGNLGSVHSELGEHEQATQLAEESLRVLRALRESSPLYRLLARQDPLGFDHCLATALNNLGVILANRGHRSKACALAEQTAELYRRLAAEAPVVFEPELARALHNLGLSSAEIGHSDVALSATREAVHLHRSMLHTESTDYRLHLGRSLCSFAAVRAHCGDELGEALAAAAEAVRLHESLAEQCPQAFSGDLHGAYRTMSSVRAALAGRTGESSGRPGTDPDS